MNNILAIDASSVTCSAAVMQNGKLLAEQFINNGLTHSQTLLCAVETVMRLSALTVKDLDAIAVTVGPGSFTGIKIGVATAKGLAFANETPCIEVSSLEAAAYNGLMFNGTVCAVMDARRGQFYNALFKVENGKLTRLCEDRRIEKDELISKLDKNALIVGDAASMLSENGFLISAPSQRYVSASNILSIVFNGDGEMTDHIKLAPVYLRAPQAERERLEKLKETSK